MPIHRLSSLLLGLVMPCRAFVCFSIPGRVVPCHIVSNEAACWSVFAFTIIIIVVLIIVLVVIVIINFAAFLLYFMFSPVGYLDSAPV